MIKIDAENKLKEYADHAYTKKMHRINGRVYHFVGYGHSNCTVIEGNTSLILIDTLDSDVRGERLRSEIESLLNKSVKTIIYTHGHPDHRGGAAAFRDTAEEIIAFSPKRAILKYTEKIADILNSRTSKQFGYNLNDEELITQGIGKREGLACGEGGYQFLPPTTVYHEEKVERVIDGVTLVMVSAVGETDDQMFIWLPEDKVLCCGDNYYACWPNLSAIRGGQYRDIAAWIDSLDLILSYPAEALLPGHTNPVLGYERIQEVLGDYRDAIQSVLFQSLECIRQGMSENETAQCVRLPENLSCKPYLSEFYGTVAWSVRSIYHGYLGWFDGNPTNLNPLPENIYANKLLGLIGDEDKVLRAIELAMEKEEYQWALQLCDLIIQANQKAEEAKHMKAKGLEALSHYMMSANGRHYYLACSKEFI